MNIDEKIKICESILMSHERDIALKDRSYNEVSYDYIRANLITVLSSKLGIIMGNIDSYICENPDDYDLRVLDAQFDYICNNTSWECFLFDETVYEMISAIDCSEEEAQELEGLVYTDLSVLWNKNFKVSGVIQELKELIMDTVSFIDSRLIDKKYKELICAAMTTDSDYDFFNSIMCVLKNNKLKVLVENDLIDLDCLKPLQGPLMYYQFADCVYEDDYSLIAFEMGHGENGTLDMSVCDSKLFIAMYYVELLTKNMNIYFKKLSLSFMLGLFLLRANKYSIRVFGLH